MPDNRCKIWPEFIAKKVAHFEDDSRVVDVIDSPRAGGTYRIDREAAKWCETHSDDWSQQTKARLTTWLINQRSEMDDLPLVTRELIKRMEVTQDLSMQARSVRVLRLLVDFAHRPIEGSGLSIINPELLAWSESVRPDQLNRIFNILKSDGYIGIQGMVFTVTERGHQRIQELNEPPKP